MSNGDAIELERWDYASGQQGPYVLKEMKKAGVSKNLIARLEVAMKRIEDGKQRPHETDLVRDGVHELRIDVDNRWYRLMWARCGNRLVALSFVVKKTNKLKNSDIGTAVKRLADHCP